PSPSGVLSLPTFNSVPAAVRLRIQQVKGRFGRCSGTLVRGDYMAMANRPPPFAGLRVLEAACRLKSYSLTGEELGVTHSAVSQTVRRLEEAYGLKLFRRQGMRMMPTDPALGLARAYVEAARIVDRAGAELAAGAESAGLVISTLPSIAKLWF